MDSEVRESIIKLFLLSTHRREKMAAWMGRCADRGGRVGCGQKGRRFGGLGNWHGWDDTGREREDSGQPPRLRD
jgi:hypothetical protein